ARHPRSSGQLRGPRLDGVSDFTRAGDRRAALHARGDHRQGRIGRAEFARGHPAGKLARESLPRKGGRRRGEHAQAQLARGGGLVNWQHLKTFFWLRWRLAVNQWRRAGTLNLVLMMIFAVSMAVMAVPVFIGSVLIGIYAFDSAEPVHLMYVWDGLVIAFVFF